MGNDENHQGGELVVGVRGCAGEAVQVSAEVEAFLERLVAELPPLRVAALVADLTGSLVRAIY